MISNLSFKDLTRARGINKAFHRSVDDYLKVEYSRDLRTYVDRPLQFREVLRSTRSVISGSFVVRFVMRRTEQGDMRVGDLDIYCPLSSASGVITYLEEDERYGPGINITHDPDDELEEAYPISAISCVTRLYRESTQSRIDVITSDTNSPLLPIRHFWCTLVTNYMSADGICLTHPKLTLDARGCIAPAQLGDVAIEHAVEKYRARGFRIGTFVDNDATHQGGETTGYCPQRLRNFNDSLSLTFKFDSFNEAQLLHTFPILEPTWKYGGWLCGGRCVPADPAGNTILTAFIV
ncbi:hypothetical protein FA95DRAFT_1504173 [Auriscalpium vulgare]|uniref:Uncharacterized protein n=1 Tax=Auriscalpium vulgare TaxID=40419 RepID=A0ACB8R739_9AGAM|nr:hypothetical protein FA95DRAFT_1504173 [Auriscalpium vulgare]